MDSRIVDNGVLIQKETIFKNKEFVKISSDKLFFIESVSFTRRTLYIENM